MKYALLLLACSIIGFKARGNAIDSLKTREDVLKFLTSKLWNRL